ncbi:siderophore-interacting protein [Kitasatospora sp. NBC_01539]|uniref:siderophore-interacting protein n=1 Tax=Kitasatospora sp. NBC_01539 TaxID=2903577 RepID=UPI0038602C62
MSSASAPEAAEFGFFGAAVVRTARLGPTLLRITFGGEGLRGFRSGGRDQSLSLFLPHPGQDAPVLPLEAGDGWFAAWRALDPAVAAVMRSYTVRAHRPEQAEVDVDFALHGVGTEVSGPAGPAARWAAGARPGDRVVLLGPAVADNRSVGFRPPADAEWVLLAADETALPAVGSVLESLPEDLPATVFVSVPYAADVQELAGPPGTRITWLVREAGDPGLPEAVRAADLPAGRPYAWLAGEAGAVRALRRHLVGERGTDRRSVCFSGYWRRGVSEEQLRAEAAAAAGPAD